MMSCRTGNINACRVLLEMVGGPTRTGKLWKDTDIIYIYIYIKHVLRLMDLVRDIHDSAITLYWEIKLLIVKTHQVTEQYTDYESPSKHM